MSVEVLFFPRNSILETKMEREDDLRNLNGDVSSQPDGDVEDDNPLVLSPQAFTAESACIACPTLDVYLKVPRDQFR